ncbi:hypothetical protein MAP00_001149 [Monascus purpureus]|nr:hypothetical protein MAP00_001149 [Monascus purpureus]
MIMDEATASMDMESDARIQRSIREDIQGCTLLVIAHRLSTVADFDRILVMDDGKAVEFDTPAAPMGIEDGIFRGLVEQSSDRNDDRPHANARQSSCRWPWERFQPPSEIGEERLRKDSTLESVSVSASSTGAG